MRLDTCHSTNRIHVEYTDESHGKDRNLCLDGIGLLVRSPPHARDVARLNQKTARESVSLSEPYCSPTVPLKQIRVIASRYSPTRIIPTAKS